MTQWRWKYFTRDELKCKGDGTFVANNNALDKLERLRELMGVPLTINSAYRSPAHNRKIGGADNSMHVQGRAFDISVKGHEPSAVYTAALHAGFTGFGFYRTFLHVDTGAKRSWGGYTTQYTHNITNPPKALSTEKETEKPNKIEGVKLSDNHKRAAVATTSVVATGGAVMAINPSIIIEHAPTALSFLQSADWRVAIAVIGVLAVGGLVWWRRRR